MDKKIRVYLFRLFYLFAYKALNIGILKRYGKRGKEEGRRKVAAVSIYEKAEL